MKVICPHCGKKNDWTEMACQKCGMPLSNVSSSPASDAASQPNTPPAYHTAPPAYTPPPPPSGYYQPTYNTPPQKGLGGGAIAAIILGSIAVVIALAVVFSLAFFKSPPKTTGGTVAQSSSPKSNTKEKEEEEKEKKKKAADPRSLYNAAGGLQDEGLAPAVAAFLGMPTEDITYEQLAAIRYLELNNRLPNPDPMDWVNAGDQVVIGLSTHDRREFATQEEFEDTIFRYTGSAEHSYSLRYPDLQYFSGLTELRIVAGHAENQAYLNLAGLRILCVNDAEDLTGFSGLRELEELTVDGLDSLDGAEKLSLKKLGLIDAGVEDYAPLAAMTALESLTIDNCSGIKSLSFVSGLTGLRELHLTGLDNVTDYNPVGKLTELEALTVSDTELKRMQFLANLVNLKRFVCLENDEIKELPELESCTLLEELELDATGLDRLPTLTHMPQLRSVSLTTADDLSALQGLTGLEELRLHNCFGSYAPVGSLTGLQRLTITSYSVAGNQSLDYLRPLTSLKELDMHGSTSYYLFDTLPALTALESLDISSGTFGGNFAGLAQLTQLKKLRMDNTLLVRDATISGSNGFYGIGYTDIEPGAMTGTLAKLSSLSWLSLRGMELTDLSFASGLQQLTYLDVSDNYITDLSPVNALPALKTLLADDNPLNPASAPEPYEEEGEEWDV